LNARKVRKVDPRLPVAPVARLRVGRGELRILMDWLPGGSLFGEKNTMNSRFAVPQQVAGLAGWIAVTAVAATFGTIASLDAAAFYAQLARPSWAPPAGWFGPVWTTLFVLMAVAAWRVWRRDGFAAARGALTLYAIQLCLNALWSWLFFGWHRGAGAMIDIVALWLLIVATMRAFAAHDRVAPWLLAPYLAWVSFAAALNFAVWRMNPQLLG
jgi:tryptophan-rich sensory protein